MAAAMRILLPEVTRLGAMAPEVFIFDLGGGASGRGALFVLERGHRQKEIALHVEPR